MSALNRQAIAQYIKIVILLTNVVLAIRAVPLSSNLYTEYLYDYESSITSNHTGFKFTAKVNFELLYGASAENELASEGGAPVNEFIFKLKLTEPVFNSLHENDNQLEPLVIDGRYSGLFNQDYELYAHVATLPNGTAFAKTIYTHQADATTFKNIKKSILLSLLPTNHHLKQSSDPPSTAIERTCNHDNTVDQPELFSPDSISQVSIIAKAKHSPSVRSTAQAGGDLDDASSPMLVGPTVFETVDGFQNVTLKSRVFAQARSDLSTEFHLRLMNELKSSTHTKFDQAGSVQSALKLLDLKQYRADTTELERERRVCSNHHCGKSLAQLFDNYQESLTEEAMATVEASIAYLSLLDRIRDSEGSNVQELLALLKRVKHNQGTESSLLDILAAARTKDSISAAFKHIKLTKNKNLAISERFLSALSVAAKTTAKMHHRRSLQSPYYFVPTAHLKYSKLASEHRAKEASLEYIAREFLTIFEQTPAKKWSSHKVRWSCLLTLATLVNAYNQEQSLDPGTDELNVKVSKLIMSELDSCPLNDADCRIVCLHAIGNVAYLGADQYSLLKQEIVNSGKRESVAATRVLRDLMQNRPKDKPLDDKFYKNLKDLLLRVVYDSSHETTARVLAAEMVVRFIPNSLVSEEILRHLPSFGNTELATMVYSRMSSLNPSSLAKHHDNWYWRSCIINGTSTSFVRTMAKTDLMDASYGVNVENSNKGKILKESSFDVFLDTKRQTQDILSLGIFTRGVSGLTGSSDDDGGESDKESTMAGMTLRILGGYLRPIVFFNSMGELMGHVWAGTASEPTTAFDGDLLLIDHDEGYPLISGFVAEQQMRGVLSIDVSGKISISIWHRSSDSSVKTKASIGVRASQSVFTSFDNLYNSHLFSIGGQAEIDFTADVLFAHTPIQTCLQVSQPEFKIRYHSRRHDRMMTNEVRRRLTRQMYSIGGKSYPLNTENNKMCSVMLPGEL